MQEDEPRSDMNVDGVEGVVKDEVVDMAAKSRKRKRLEALKDIQSQHGELEAKFLEERASLQAKYHKLYEQLYTKRYEIVNGEAEAEDLTTQTSESPAEEKNSKGKGVPDFWLTAMKTNEVLTQEIEESDEQALKFLKDIRLCKLDDAEGFQLDFYFDPNPFFRNLTLTKIYHITDGDDLLIEKIIGTKIEWYQGKCLTKKVLVKTPRKKSKNMIPKAKIEKCKSFFNFFEPPQPPENVDVDENAVEEFQTQIKQDYDIGTTIRDNIIPYAISLFTGVAARVSESGGDEQTDDDAVDVGGEEIWTSPTSVKYPYTSSVEEGSIVRIFSVTREWPKTKC